MITQTAEPDRAEQSSTEQEPILKINRRAYRLLAYPTPDDVEFAHLQIGDTRNNMLFTDGKCILALSMIIESELEGKSLYLRSEYYPEVLSYTRLDDGNMRLVRLDMNCFEEPTPRENIMIQLESDPDNSTSLENMINAERQKHPEMSDEQFKEWLDDHGEVQIDAEIILRQDEVSTLAEDLRSIVPASVQARWLAEGPGQPLWDLIWSTR